MIITCAKTNLPLLGGPDWIGHPFPKVVLLREDRSTAAGWYDGAGGLGGLDLLGSGILDEIEAGAACLVLGSKYRPGDLPSNLGRSRVWIGTGRGPTREFIASRGRLGSFATFEGFALACEGKVPPDMGAALTAAQVIVLDRLGQELRQAVATRLTALSNLGPSRPWLDPGNSVASAIGLELVPFDLELRTLRILGGQALEVGCATLLIRNERQMPMPGLASLVDHLIRGFPPPKFGSVKLVRDGSPEGTLTRHAIPELATCFQVSAALEAVGVLGSLHRPSRHRTSQRTRRMRSHKRSARLGHLRMSSCRCPPGPNAIRENLLLHDGASRISRPSQPRGCGAHAFPASESAAG